ncbi:MAG: ATPase [bacterium]
MTGTFKRCAKCVLTDKMPHITFDKNGVCNYCNTYKNFKFQGEQELLRILDLHRGKSKNYDCIVNISGGRDSAYTLLKLKKDYGMRVLAVNYENPFTDNQAKKNIDHMVKILKVDIIRFAHKSNIHESCFRNNLISWFRHPSPAMVPMMCIGCKIIWKKILKIAKTYDIRLIINGGNPYEYTSFKKELLDVSSNEPLTATYYKYGKGLVKKTLANTSYLFPQYLPVLAKGFFYNNQYSIGSQLSGKNIKKIDLFHFIPWSESEIIARITNELYWDYPHELGSTWRFDCKIGHLKDYMYMTTLGMTEKDDFYAKMVREGLMTREQALKRLNDENKIHPDIIRDIFRKSNLTPPKISI